MRYISIFSILFSLFTTAHAQQWLWAKTYTSTVTDFSANSLAVDSLYQIYAASPVDTSGSVIIKTDPNGNELWRKFISGNIAVKDIECWHNNLYICGVYKNSFSLSGTTYTNAGGTDFFISSIDGSGNLQWIKTYGGNGNDEVQDLCIGNSKLFVIGSYNGTLTSGSFSVTANPTSFFFSRLDLTGNMEILKSATSSYSYAGSQGYKMDYMTGEIKIAGSWIDQIILDTLQLNYYTNNSYGAKFLATCDWNGNFNKLEWMGGPFCTYTGLKMNPDSTYILAGWNSWTNGYTGIEYSTKKNHPNGFSNTVSQSCYGDEVAISDAITASNGYLLFGQMHHGSNCVMPAVTHTLFLRKLNDTSSTVYHHELPSTANIYGYRIAKQGPFFIVSGIMNNGGIRFGQDSLHCTTPAIFIAKFSDALVTASFSNEPPQSNLLSIYPNPSVGEITLKFEHNSLSSLLITDQLGREVLFSDKIQQEVNVKLVPGFYTVSFLNEGGQSFTKKLIVK